MNIDSVHDCNVTLMLIISMAELLVKHICTPMALVALDQLLYICQGVGLSLPVGTAVGTCLTSKLTNTRKRQKLI